MLKSRLVSLVTQPMRWCLARRWRTLAALAVLLAVIVGTSALLIRRGERRTAKAYEIAENGQRLERALEREDYTNSEALLARLAEQTHDPAVESRLAALRRGEADPGDAALARLLMVEHLRQNRWPDAMREASKVIASKPGHMLARGLLARQCLEDRRPADARAHLAAIPSPFTDSDTVTPGGLILILGLKKELGDDDSELLAFIADRLVPILKLRDADTMPPADGVQLLKCYHLACAALDRHPQLAEYWVPAARLLARVTNDQSRPTANALLRESHLAVVYRLRQMKALSEKDAEGLIGELEQQVAAEWSAAQQRDERDPLPYAGLALASQRRGDRDTSRQWLERGLKNSENPRDLYLLLGRLLGPSEPLTAAVFLEQGHERYPNDQAIQQMLAELALAAGRPDRAIVVCQAARAKEPVPRWACRVEAIACLTIGRPTQALEALAPIRAALANDAASMEVYVRAACAVGADAMLEEMLPPTPVGPSEIDGHLGAARGYLVAQRPADAARQAESIIERFPEHPPARMVHAESLRVLAESGDGKRWSAERVREALAAFEWLQRRDPSNRHLAQRIAWLQLKGLDAPALALRSAAPLREPKAVLSFEMTETLGAVLLANGELAEALRCFEAVIAQAPSRAGAHIGRAAVLVKSGRRADASAELNQAAALSRTPSQTADWERVAQELRGMK